MFSITLHISYVCYYVSLRQMVMIVFRVVLKSPLELLQVCFIFLFSSGFNGIEAWTAEVISVVCQGIWNIIMLIPNFFFFRFFLIVFFPKTLYSWWLKPERITEIYFPKMNQKPQNHIVLISIFDISGSLN